MKTAKSTQSTIDPMIDETKKHPFLEKKLEKANKILKRFGLPKELALG